MTALDGEMLFGDEAMLHREAEHMLVCGMNVEHVLARLLDGQLCIAPGDRPEVLVALAAAHAAEGFPSLAGIVLNGGYRPGDQVVRLVRGLDEHVPIIVTAHDSYDAARIVASDTRAARPRHAAQDRHCAERVRRARRAGIPAAHPRGPPQRCGHAADVRVDAARTSTGRPSPHRAARGRRRAHPARRGHAPLASGRRPDVARRSSRRSGRRPPRSVSTSARSRSSIRGRRSSSSRSPWSTPGCGPTRG